jgi:hypothetical protein
MYSLKEASLVDASFFMSAIFTHKQHSMCKRLFIGLLLAVTTMDAVAAQKRPVVSPGALKPLIGCWQATLHYSGTVVRKPFTTTADVVVTQIATGKYQLLYVYTNDPDENVADTIAISKDGKRMRHATITTRRYTKAGDLQIVAEEIDLDRDNNTAVKIRETYTIGKQRYIYIKQVQPTGQADWLDRQEFIYTRQKCSSKKNKGC